MAKKSVAKPARTELPDPRVVPRFGGLVTFSRWPRVQDVRAASRPLDWVALGVPFDSGVTFRPGARFGPRAIREASQTLRRFSIEHGVDLAETLSLADAGDAQTSPFDLQATMELVYQAALSAGGGADKAAGAGGAKTKVLGLGGDHSITFGLLHAAFERQGRPKGGLGLVHVDSHLDTVDQVWGHGWSHASPFRRAVEAGLVNPRKMISLGIKGPLNSAADLDFAREHGVTIVTAADWHEGAGARRLKAFVRGLRGTPTYVSFDVDAVDPAFAPGTGTPAPGGLTSAQALALLRGLKGLKLAGADVVEVLPDRDVSGITALLAAQIAFEILALDAAAAG